MAKDKENIETKGAEEECSYWEHHVGALALIADKCIECGLCLRECGFLRNYGLPKQLAERVLADDQQLEKISFSCSLCRLCTTVCPEQLPMAEMFLDLRRRVVRRGEGRFKGHRPLRFYEWIGGSSLFTSYLLPQGCKEVFFPGCAMCGNRPEAVVKAVENLRMRNPLLGVVLDCCHQPSHDLGDHMHFLIEFGRKADHLVKMGVTHVIVGCPSCFQVFSEYGGDLSTSLVYTHLANVIDTENSEVQESGEVTVHDPCTLRYNQDIQTEIRELIGKTGRKVVEMEHSGAKTLCCGAGGAAAMYDAQKCAGWQELRHKEMKGMETITYCAGCSSMLDTSSEVNLTHIIDLIFPPEGGPDAQATVRPPKTYLNRLLLKLRLQRLLRS